MALQVNNFTGFETQGSEEASEVATPVYNTTTKRSGSSALEISSLNFHYVLPWIANIADAGSAYILGFAFNITDNAVTGDFVRIEDDTGSNIFNVHITSAGALQIEDAAGSALDTSVASYDDGAWHYVEIYAQLNSASAAWEWFIDGNSEGSGSGADLTDGNGFGSATSGVSFSVAGNDTIYYDDVYILSGATAASDRLGDCEVFKYQSVKNSITPDDGGGDLDAGTWNRAGETPLAATATNPEYTSAGVGAVDSDNTNGSPEGPKNDARIDGDSNIKAIKGIWNMQRGTGGGAAHYGLLGNSGDGAARSADFDPPVAFANYFKLSEASGGAAGDIPLSSEYCRIGFETTGAQDFECKEMWAMLLHVPAVGGPPPTINLVMAPYAPA